jgi:Ca-activated chloride channel family protein
MKYFVLILLIFTAGFCDELKSLNDKGISAYKKGNFDKALQYFNEAAQKYPESSEAKFNKGLALGASGNVKEAEAILSGVKFDNTDKNAEVLYSRARIAEAVGDVAVSNEQQPNIAEAKKAYKTARSLYAQSLDLKKQKKTINNIEILSQKIKRLPESDEQNQDENQDKNDKDENNKDKDENQNNNEQKDEQKENDNEEQEQNRQEQQEQDEKIEDAVRLLEHYADDAKELNRPPMQKAVSSENGKDW